MKRFALLVLLAGVLLPAGLALRAQETSGEDIDALIRQARQALAEKLQAVKRKGPIEFVGRVHDIRDLTTAFVDRPGHALDLAPSAGFGFGFFESEEAEALPFYEGETILDLVRESVAPGSWDELRSVSIDYRNGMLVVKHTPAVQKEIEAFLEELRARAASQVTVGVRFVRLKGAGLRSLLEDGSAAVFGADAESRLAALVSAGEASIVHEGAVQCVNTQRVNLTETVRESYLADHDVEIAETSAISDPIFRALETGVVVDVRPVLAGAGDVVVLQVRADVARRRGEMESVETPNGHIETPDVDVLKLRSTIATRLGRTVALGGALADGDDAAMLLLLTPTASRPGAK